MACYVNVKGGIPFHKRAEERRWKEHIKQHKDTVSLFYFYLLFLFSDQQLLCMV